jgi:hypothetical protein
VLKSTYHVISDCSKANELFRCHLVHELPHHWDTPASLYVRLLCCNVPFVILAIL